MSAGLGPETFALAGPPRDARTLEPYKTLAILVLTLVAASLYTELVATGYWQVVEAAP
jgi:hypothetical protein